MALVAVDVGNVEAIGPQPKQHVHGDSDNLLYFAFFENIGEARGKVLVSKFFWSFLLTCFFLFLAL